MRIWIPTLCVALLGVVLLLGPALLHPASVPWGHPHSEAMGHLWRLEMVTDGLFRYGPFVTASDQVLFPDGLRADFADPVNLVFFAPVFWLTGSPVLAWNALFLGWIAVAVAGCAALARRVAPDRGWPGAVLVTAIVTGAWWLGFDRASRTEYLPALLLPLHLAWLRDALLTDSRRAPWLAGLTFAGLVLGGWYLAVFAGIVVGPVALAWGVRAGSSRALRVLAVMGIVSGVLVLPAFLSFLDSGREVLETQGRRGLPPSVQVSVPGVASFFHQIRIPIPRAFFLGQDQPAYPGIVAILAAIAGAFASPPAARRNALGWLALVGWILLWAVGFDFVLADDAGRVTHAVPGLPRFLHAIVPVTAAITGWNRLGCMVGVPMGLALVTALQAPLARWKTLRRAVPLLVVAMLADQLTWPQPFQLRAATFDPHPPRGLVAVSAALPPGALLLLPVDVPDLGEGRMPVPPFHQHYVYWRRELGRAITGGYAHRLDSTIERSPFTKTMLAVQVADATREAIPAASPCLGADARRLLDLGVSAVVLVGSLPHAAALERVLRAGMGAPTVAREDALGWDLAALDEPAGCPGTP